MNPPRPNCVFRVSESRAQHIWKRAFYYWKREGLKPTYHIELEIPTEIKYRSKERQASYPKSKSQKAEPKIRYCVPQKAQYIKSALNHFDMPTLTALFFILSCTIPLHIPVTNDFITKGSNCTYILKSASEDMALFCGELMWQFSSGSETMREMFIPAVNIGNSNSWGLGIAIESENEGETYWYSGITPDSKVRLCYI